MEFIDVVKGRRSIRKFSDKFVKKDDFYNILDIVRHSPSWKNTQGVRFIFIDDTNIITKIAEDCVNGFTYNTKTLLKAPSLVIELIKKHDSDYTDSKEASLYNMYDAGIYGYSFTLAAYSLGFDTCLMGIFNDKKIRELLNISDEYQIATLIPLGYRLDNPKDLEKLSATELEYTK